MAGDIPFIDKFHLIGEFQNFEPYTQKHWTEIQRDMECRPAWGQYYDFDSLPVNDLFSQDDFENWCNRPIYCWMGQYIEGQTPIEEVQEITQWLKENIDNVWEGPIGYMGWWKFRFTEETDIMAFKLMFKF